MHVAMQGDDLTPGAVRALLAAINDDVALENLHPWREIIRPPHETRRSVAARVLVLTAFESGGRQAALEREIIRLSDFEELPHKAVAAELGLSQRTFYRHRARAIRRIVGYMRMRYGGPLTEQAAS